MMDALAEKKARGAGEDLFQLRLKKSDVTPKPLDYEAEGQRFQRPTTLAELLDIKAREKEKAELVAGATELGVPDPATLPGWDPKWGRFARGEPLMWSVTAASGEPDGDLAQVRRTSDVTW